MEYHRGTLRLTHSPLEIRAVYEDGLIMDGGSADDGAA